jgi:hypothetical protein
MLTKPEAKVAGISAALAGAVTVLLMQFGLIGPDAERKSVSMESRLVALEVKQQALKLELNSSMQSLERLIEVRLAAIESTLKEIRSDIKKKDSP